MQRAKEAGKEVALLWGMDVYPKTDRGLETSTVRLRSPGGIPFKSVMDALKSLGIPNPLPDEMPLCPASRARTWSMLRRPRSNRWCFFLAPRCFSGALQLREPAAADVHHFAHLRHDAAVASLQNEHLRQRNGELQDKADNVLAR